MATEEGIKGVARKTKNHKLMDAETTVGELKQLIKQFRDDRDWKKYHKPKDLAISLSLEAAELLELFQWRNDEEINEMLKDPKYLEEIRKELSDIFNYGLAVANILDIDVSSTLIEKVKHNSEKYPVDKTKGAYKKYSQL